MTTRLSSQVIALSRDFAEIYVARDQLKIANQDRKWFGREVSGRRV
jgi:hypothetical protein